MEVDIDLAVDLSSVYAQTLMADLPKKYAVSPESATGVDQKHHMIIRYADSEPQLVLTDVGVLVVEFLEGLSPSRNSMAFKGGELRLGIYYDLNESVVFSLRLDAQCIRLMGELDLSLNSTGYLCSEEQA